MVHVYGLSCRYRYKYTLQIPMDPSWGSQIHADLPVCCQVWEHHLKRPGVRFERKSEAWNLTFHVKMEITEIALPTSSKIHIFQLLSLKHSRRRLQKLKQNQPLGCFGLGFLFQRLLDLFCQGETIPLQEFQASVQNGSRISEKYHRVASLRNVDKWTR